MRVGPGALGGPWHTVSVSSEKPRILQGSRDIILSLLVLGVVIFVVIFPTGLCTFNPGAPENGPIPEADVPTYLQMESSRLPFEIRDVDIPEGWTANSTRATVVDGHQSSIIGFVTDNGTFVQLLQTDAPLDALPNDGEPRTQGDPVETNGVTWNVDEGVDDGVRTTWVADDGDIRFEIKGSASPDDYRILAERAVDAPVYEADVS